MPEKSAPKRPTRNLLGYHRKQQSKLRIPAANPNASRLAPGNLNLLTRESRE